MKIIIEFYIFELVQVLYSSFSKFNMLEQSSQKSILPIENRKTEPHHRVFHIRISLNTKFQLKLTLLTFWTKFVQNRYFQSKKIKWKQHWILNIQISWGINFQFEQTIWVFGTNLPKKGILNQKLRKIEHLHQKRISDLKQQQQQQQQN